MRAPASVRQTDETAPARAGRWSAADGMLFGCVLVWSINVPFLKIMLRYWQPLPLAAVRMLVAFIAFVAIVWLREGAPMVRRRDLLLLLAAGTSGIFANQVCFVYALHFTLAANVALLLATIPVFAAIMSSLIGFEALAGRFWLGLPIALGGVALIVVTQPHSHLGLGTVGGDVLALATALSWATYTILLRVLTTRYSTARISVWVIGIGLVGLLPLGVAGFNPGPAVSAPWWTWGIILYSAIPAIVGTNYLWYTGINRLGPARGSVYAFLQPFAGALAALAILAESISGFQILGGILIIAGIWLGRRQGASAAAEAVSH